MSKSTTPTSKTPSDATKTRSRAATPAGTAAAASAAPKTPRTRRKAQPAVEVANAADTLIVSVAPARLPSHDEIATRAYFIALERGFSSDPLADWLTAERELAHA